MIKNPDNHDPRKTRNLYPFLTALTWIEAVAEIRLEDLEPNKIGSGISATNFRPKPKCSQPRQAELRITLQKFILWKFGSLSAKTSALTLPNVVSGLCLMPLQKA